MPDLTFSDFYWCEQNEWYREVYTGSNGEEYIVTCSPWNRGSYAANWNCTCKGFQFRGTCKHVKEAEKKRCTWGEDAACGSGHSEKPEGGVCPECGGPIKVIRVAV
jgi:hypothetical protein